MTNSSATTRRTSRKKTEIEKNASPHPLVPPQQRPILLLHICCGPCATHVIDLLRHTYHLIGFFYNPNLYPRDEYLRRLEAVARVSRSQGTALWVPRFEPEVWMNLVKGLEDEPERGERCNICIRHRLEATARAAKAASLKAFATSLTVGPQKKSIEINRLGSEVSESYGITFLEADFKKRDGFLKSLQKSKQLGLYRQNYCGCRYSMRRP